MKGNLDIRNVKKYYKDFLAVNDISLTVNQGEFFTILGPSGSGKTTLLKLIAGFETLSEGNILLDGKPIANLKPYERNIGMVFQNYALFPHMTVKENIAYPLKRRKYKKDEIDKLVDNVLDIVQLNRYKNHYPKQLSGGQQQRVALARAIVFSPPLLLLDEPLGALDKNLRQRMQIEIKNIQVDLGITTISVTHDQEEALTMSDRICVMNEGRVEQIDTPENIYKYPRNKFVAQFIGEINLIKGTLEDCDQHTATLNILDNRIANTENHTQIGKEHIGGNVVLALRPEVIEIVKEERDRNTFKGKITSLVYLGESVILNVKPTINSDSDKEIIVKRPANQMNGIKIGEEMIFAWNPEDSVVLLDD